MRPPDEMDFNKVLQMLYVVDRFAVSDDAYHELSVVSDLPPHVLYLLKNTRTSLNSSLDLQCYDGPYQGAYRPFVETLKNKISKVVSTNSCNNYLHVPLITYIPCPFRNPNHHHNFLWTNSSELNLAVMGLDSQSPQTSYFCHSLCLDYKAMYCLAQLLHNSEDIISKYHKLLCLLFR